VTVSVSTLKSLFAAALLVVGGAIAAEADDAPPSQAALQSARTVILASGMGRSFDVVVPQMFGELERTITQTRPEVKDSLHATLLALVPEFNRTELDVINAASVVLAKKMSEQELKDTADFFNSPSGKKYVAAEPAAFAEIVAIVQSWREKLSTDVLTRAREEMKKKGVDF
jgi:uncharacterized protein